MIDLVLLNNHFNDLESDGFPFPVLYTATVGNRQTERVRERKREERERTNSKIVAGSRDRRQ